MKVTPARMLALLVGPGIALEQLRVLGELRDAGFVTDEEFARIKRKILDSEF